MRKLFHFFLQCLLLTAAFSSSAAVAEEKIVLQLRWLHQAQFIGYYVAKHKGFYSEAGLKVEIQSGGPGIVPWQQVMQGKADYAVDNTNALTAYNRGNKLLALAAVFQHSPSVFLTKRSSGINTVRDLDGKRVMIFPGNEDPELMAMLRYQKMDSSRVDLLPTSADIRDLILDKVDVFNAYMTNEPYYLEQAGIPYNIINPRNYGIDFYSDILITSQERVTTQPKQVRTFLEASLRGWRYALDHPEESLDILEMNYPVKKNRSHSRYEFNRVREMVLPDFVEIGHMNPERWRRIEGDLIKLGIIDDPTDLDGFIYSPAKPVDLSVWLPWIIGGSGALLIALITMTFLSYMNRRLSREIESRKEVEKQLLHLATHDALTSLPNRTLLNDELNLFVNLAQRNQTTPALIYLDLDGFKEVNDQYGHHIGDRLLQEFSNRLHLLIRKSDVFGRLAGDEFLVILENCSQRDCQNLAEKMLHEIRTPFIVDQIHVSLDASIGIARYTDPGEKASAFLNRADNAMYIRKKSGKGGIHFP